MFFLKKMKLSRLLKKVRKLHQLRDQGGKVDSKHEIAALKELAKFYDKNPFNKNIPQAETLALEYYRAAAALNDAQAQYICSERFFKLGLFWQAWANDIYGSTIHKEYAQGYFTEAYTYVKAAEEGGYALAKRLHGLAYIHGWGVTPDTSHGFQMVLDSIEMEKAWERATKIIENLKLNSPEFFSALMKYKSSKK